MATKSKKSSARTASPKDTKTTQSSKVKRLKSLADAQKKIAKKAAKEKSGSFSAGISQQESRKAKAKYERQALKELPSRGKAYFDTKKATTSKTLKKKKK